MTTTIDGSAILAELGRRAGEQGPAALVIGDPPEAPHMELLVPRAGARGFGRALDEMPWRWRIGGDGPWRLLARRRYVFDGGFVVTVHRALPAGPLPAVALRRLTRSLWANAQASGDGLLRARPEPLLVHLAVQAARGALRSSREREQLEATASAVSDWPAVWSLARAAGAARQLEREGAPVPASSPRGRALAVAWRTARALRDRGRPRRLALALLGEPWEVAPTRCRFDGLELVAEPGIFLPRRVSEGLVRLGAEHLHPGEERLVADVGTGCGAVALALASRRPGAEVIGVDLDANAIRSARRNAGRLGLANVRFASGSLLDPLPEAWRGRVSLICANVPCVPAVRYVESSDAPALAYLGADPDGLGLQRRLAEQAFQALAPGGRLLVQLAPDQWPVYGEVLEALGFEHLDAQGDTVAVVASGTRP